MKKSVLVFLVASSMAFTGCDWVRSKLDMPTSEDIEAKKEQIAKAEADSKVAADSVGQTLSAQQAQDTSVQNPSVQNSSVQNLSVQNTSSEGGSSALPVTPRSNLNKNYYIIVGAFKTDALAAASVKEHTGILETPIVFWSNGLKLISIGGFDTLDEARTALLQVHKSAPDAWVYRKHNP